MNSPHKGQRRGTLMFSLSCTWINDWVNNRVAGDLRRHRAHCDVIVMVQPPLKFKHGWVITVTQRLWNWTIYACLYRRLLPHAPHHPWHPSNICCSCHSCGMFGPPSYEMSSSRWNDRVGSSHSQVKHTACMETYHATDIFAGRIDLFLPQNNTDEVSSCLPVPINSSL